MYLRKFLPIVVLGCLAVVAPRAFGQLRISEFMASNTQTLADEDGSYQDWIEIQNTSSVAVNLYNWSLTDDSGNLTRWQFPATNIPPGGFIVVFASDKNRRTPGAPLHTNFKLSSDGEYLALVDASGTNVVSEFSPYPGQVENVSYGFALTTTNVTLVATGATARVLVPSVANGGSTLDYAWTGAAANEPFNASSWTSGATGIGFGVAGVGLNIQSAMLNNNASAFMRMQFNLTSTNFSLMTLRLRYNDGYVAWINGVEVSRSKAPEEDLAWNSSALATNSPATFENMVIGGAHSLLRTGTNILAIQGLNISAANSTFFVLPELLGTTIAGESATALYFVNPTPGSENLGGTVVPGPGIANVAHTPSIPLDGHNVVVTAKVFPTANPVAVVRLYYRVMYGSEVMLTMFDDGAHGDGASGDGIYGASIPASASTVGQMVRYYITAQDSGGNPSRLPVFTDPAATAQYFGTVIEPDYITSKVPVFHMFIDPANQGAADSQNGSRCSFYYDGEFYDNIGINLRGNTTGGYAKKSHRLEFNREHKLRHPGPGPRLRDTSLMAEFIDPMYLRHYLSFWLLEQAGHNAPFHYPVRVQNNGVFYQFAYHQEVLGNEQLERFGFDPEGSLYKAVGILSTSPCSTGGGPEPKTAAATDMADYYSLANAISSALPLDQRKTNLFEMLDLPDIINYMACTRITHEDDDIWANMSVYRDTFGDQLWRVIPFDLNLSWGQTYANGTIQAVNDGYRSHPLWGSSPLSTGGACGGFNHLYDAIIRVPETRAMLLRRLRSVMDQFLQPPGTPGSSSVLMQHISYMTNQIWAEAFQDRSTWGWPPNSGPYAWGTGLWLTNGVNSFISQFLEPRRVHLYVTHCATNTAKPIGLSTSSNAGIPTSQDSNLVISITAIDYNPASGNQDEEYIQLTNSNSVAVDLSGWELEGGIRFKVKGGTVMPPNSVLYVSPDVRAFRSRVTGPSGGRGLFVVGPYDGRLNAWGEALTLADHSGRLVSSNSFAGNPSPAQRYLRVTEIMYNPSAAAAITNDAQQFEYVELKNISTNVTLNLAGVRFTNGIAFNFTGASVTSLTPGQAVLLVRNQAAFTARYGAGFTIAGEFAGALDNGGEVLRLEDAVGEKILEFDYEDDWYPITDGLGFSLVVVDENAHWSQWDGKSNWRASGSVNGSPGAIDPAPPQFAPVLVNEVLTHTDLPQVDTIELYNPNTNGVNIGGWFLTDDFYAPKKYRLPNGTTIGSNSFLTITENQFNVGANAFRLSELGEDIYLFAADAATNLTGYYHGYDFGEAPNGIAFGRYTNSQNDVAFVLQSAVTLGAANAYPRVGPIVISEIMYHPPGTNGVDNDLEEFVELQNIVATNVPLYEAAAVTNTWRIRNAVDFNFPTNRTLAAGARCLVVGFDPTNAIQLAAFRARWGVSNNIAVYGPWSGKLDNSGETLELKQPGPVDDTLVVPYYLIDKVAYKDQEPWPAGADGIGNSLQRISNSGYGNDPTNWFAAGVTAGRASQFNIAPAVYILMPTNGMTVVSSNGISALVSANDPDGSVSLVQFFGDGVEVGRWSAPSTNFVWAASAGPHELKARVTDNLGAVADSLASFVVLMTPPPNVAITSPSNRAIVSAGSVVTLGANATSAGSPAAKVDYFVNGIWISSATAPFNSTWTSSVSGYHTVSAIAYDATGQVSEPSSVTVFVQAVNANPVMIPAGSSWRYLDNGVDQGTAWAGPGFIDQSWPSGVGRFGYNSANNGFGTILNFGPNPSAKYPAYYFRRQFVAPVLAGMTNLYLEVQRDDGVAVYLNGQDLFRNNLPTGTIAYSQTATNASDNGNAWQTAILPITALLQGTNTLAAEVHQSSGGSSDLVFDLRLTLLGYSTGPAITSEPQDVVATNGQATGFSVTAIGSGPLSYQWQHNGTNIPGANATVLQISSGSPATEGVYHVLVSNAVASVLSMPATLTLASSDTDGDGMSDAWENANGMNPSVDDRNTDLDGDGHTNFQEFVAGTSPTNVLSVLKLDSISRLATDVVFSFTAVSNRSYTLQFRTALNGAGWSNGGSVSAVASNRTVWMTNSASAGASQFFRLVTPSQP